MMMMIDNLITKPLEKFHNYEKGGQDILPTLAPKYADYR